MSLTPLDLRVLRLASGDAEGRLGFFLAEDGTTALLRRGGAPLPAGDALHRLQDLGLMRRDLNRSFVLTPDGWEAVRRAGPGD